MEKLIDQLELSRNPTYYRGFSLWEILITIAIVGVLASVAIPFQRERWLKQQINIRLQELMRAIAIAQRHAMHEGVTYVIEPLINNNWQTGFRVMKSAQCNNRSRTNVLQETRWRKSIIDISWQGIYQKNCLIVSSRLLASRMNGRFSLFSGNYRRTLVINRLGRQRVE